MPSIAGLAGYIGTQLPEAHQKIKQGYGEAEDLAWVRQQRQQKDEDRRHELWKRKNEKQAFEEARNLIVNSKENARKLYEEITIGSRSQEFGEYQDELSVIDPDQVGAKTFFEGFANIVAKQKQDTLTSKQLGALTGNGTMTGAALKTTPGKPLTPGASAAIKGIVGEKDAAANRIRTQMAGMSKMKSTGDKELDNLLKMRMDAIKERNDLHTKISEQLEFNSEYDTSRLDKQIDVLDKDISGLDKQIQAKRGKVEAGAKQEPTDYAKQVAQRITGSIDTKDDTSLEPYAMVLPKVKEFAQGRGVNLADDKIQIALETDPLEVVIQDILDFASRMKSRSSEHRERDTELKSAIRPYGGSTAGVRAFNQEIR